MRGSPNRNLLWHALQLNLYHTFIVYINIYSQVNKIVFNIICSVIKKIKNSVIL